ncbi:MAG TPA: phosphotyrosine protein phosphatase [Micromonosporaceae bacterium]|nr:phosphotyrosine protein phosphatase [Micromonosporaceae bacterium]
MPPFTVLHVCMGNICRSPMAERLLTRAVAERVTDPGKVLHSNSAGTGGWHEGEEMNPPAARQVRHRGGDPLGFAARKLRTDLVDSADLVLTATAEQQEFVVELRPDAAGRTFVLGEFGRLLAGVDAAALPPAGSLEQPDPDAVHARGVALVEAAHALRGDDPPRPGDDLDDPWGRGDQMFGRVADEIEDTVRPFVDLLFPYPR